MNAILGGALIGLAVTIMLLFNGRVVGISGIIGNTLKPTKGDTLWRVMFILGLLVGGILLRFTLPQSFIQEGHTTTIDYIIAGLLVGFGTLLGNGCTSGHGVCGISRFSLRSILSTVTFISFGIIGVLLFKLLRGEL
ncbi:MAG: YeeE/YedE family protein [Bacteriovoracaceae bacterium]